VFEFAKKWRMPARKFGTSQDFGDFVAMFCSEQATYVIGQSLVIDGGIDNTTF
jgi:3-oxoacyl-[acyl-carrier protein] reductase